MRINPTKILSVCAHLLILVIILACSKDNELIYDALNELEDPVVQESAAPDTSENTEENSETNAEESTESNSEESTREESDIPPGFESRVTDFPPSHDAHIQSGQGFNQQIIRLDEGNRISYLQFDLQPIQDIEGILVSIELEFTTEGDEGDGTINIFKGNSTDWTETSLNTSSAPQPDVLLGSIVKEYELGVTERVVLDVEALSAERFSIVLDHKDGNDLALASKEHPSSGTPILKVTYYAPIDAPEIQPEQAETQNQGTGNESPMAVADATPVSGKAPLEVSFSGSNSSDDVDIATYAWTFGDGNSSTAINPTHTYTDLGEYEATLTVTDAEGQSSSDVVSITVTDQTDELPVAVASASTTSGPAPLQVSFTGSNSTDDDAITSYLWDFQDNEGSSLPNPTYTFNTPGTYNVTLTVKDTGNQTHTSAVAITVTEPVNQAPTASITANPVAGTAPLQVSFNSSGSSDDNGITSYLWDFKDGEASSAPNPTHTFTEPGTYNVTLTVTDGGNLNSTATVAITVSTSSNQAPTAVATASPLSGDAPLTVTFTGSGSTDDNGITGYYWNFPGDPSSAPNATRTFSTPGSYDITLTVTDAGGLTDSQTLTITVNQGGGGTGGGGTGGGGNPPPDYYVTTNGSAYSNGLSEATAWSLSHAFEAAQPGDVIYVKAGNYGGLQLQLDDKPNTGTGPIRFIGYTNTPGDLVSSGSSTHSYGNSLNSNLMPLLSSSNQGTAMTIFEVNVHIENFQITGYDRGITALVPNFTGKNIIVTNVGNQGNSSAYDGFGLDLRGTNSVLENCFVQNASAQAITLTNADYSIVRNCSVYADNNGNPTDYYFLLAGGTNNALVENCYAERANGLSHPGHGFNAKTDATYNTFKNCVARRTNFEFTYSGVRYNTIDGGAIYGVSRDVGQWQARLSFIGAANNNTVKNFRIENTWHAIAWTIFDDTSGSEAMLANNNYFENVTVVNAHSGVVVGGGTNYGATASNNTFNNCTFQDFGAVVRTYYPTNNIVFQNSSFSYGNDLVVETGGQYAPYSQFNGSWINNSWSNVNFTPPN